MNNIEQGLAIMVMGLSITFSALALFIGVIILLQRLFPAGEEADSTEEKRVEQPVISRLARDTGEEEIAVAISVALAHLYSYELCRSNLGETLEKGHGPWWNAGQWQHFALGSVELRGRN
jgi:Na+-transporting methylmalonyl-CoA/oxaloacetate decarboxylase gamma subunit